MRRALALIAAAALGAAGLAVSPAAVASPASQASETAHEAVSGELLVGYVQGATAADRQRARGRAQASFAERIVAPADGQREVELVRLPEGRERGQAIAALQSDASVAYAEPNWVVNHAATANDPYLTSGQLWGMAAGNGSQATTAWTNGAIGDASVFIGIIDEGIRVEHSDLQGQVRNPGEIAGNNVDDDGNGKVDDVHGWDFVSNDATVYDGGAAGSSDNHGTHVAGTIGAKANNGGVVGVNWNVGMISGKFLGPNGGSIANAVKAVNYFTDLKTSRNLNIVATNNSWGGGGYSTPMFDAIKAAGSAGILFIAAAGNSGTNNDKKASYPSNYNTASALGGFDAVIAVAAIDKLGAKPRWSQYGANTVDLGAPGVDIWSTTADNGGYSSYSGTSMATPHVSGAAALYKSRNPGASAAQIRAAILGSVTLTASLSGKTVTGGRLNVSGF